MTHEIDTDKMQKDANKLAQSITVAQMVKLSDELDLEVLGELLDYERRYQTIEPLFDPTAWMREHKGMEASARVISAAITFAKVVRENKASKPGRS
jgi:hypothetical protein